MKILLEQSDSKIFDDIYPDLLVQFPKSELKSYKQFKKIMQSDYYKLIYIKHDANTVGYVLYFEYENFMWIDYVAIFKQYHSLGYGSLVFKMLKENFNHLKGCYLEVEKPDKNNINTIKRIEFYKRLGAKKLDIKYLYPNSSGQLSMDLYFMPFKEPFLPNKNSAFIFIEFIFNTLHSDLKHANNVYEKIIFLNK